MELGPYLCYQLDFLLDFFTEDKSYQYLQDAAWPTWSFLEVTSHSSFAYKYEGSVSAMRPVCRISNFSNIPFLISQ